MRIERESRVILDAKGLVMHAWRGCRDRDAILLADGKTRCQTAGAGLEAFVTRYLNRVLGFVAPRRVIAVWEGDGGKERRRALYPEYKAARDARVEDPLKIAEQEKVMTWAKQLMAALGITQLAVPGAEGDDTIAWLCQKLHGSKIVFTIDEDLVQLQEEARPDTGESITVFYRDAVIEEAGPSGVPPHLIALHKSIVGDKSDGYPGVSGMGPAAWTALEATIGLDGLAELEACVRTNDYAELEAAVAESGDKNLAKLLASREQWSTCYQLAILHPEWCEGRWKRAFVKPTWYKRVPSVERLDQVLNASHCQHLRADFMRWMPQQFFVEKADLDAETMREIVDGFKASPLVAFDYESYDKLNWAPYREASGNPNFVDVLNQVLTGCSFCYGDNYQYGVYVPTNHKDTDNLPNSVVASLLAQVPNDVLKVAQNAAFEVAVSKLNLDGWYPKDVADTAMMAHHVDENEPIALKALSKRWLNYDQITYLEVTQGRGMNELTVREVLKYGCDDSLVTAWLFDLFKLILELEGTWDRVAEVEFAPAYVLSDAYIEGVPVNMERLGKLAEKDAQARKVLEAELRSLLEQHCPEVNEEGYAQLWEERRKWMAIYLADANAKREAPLSEEAFQEALEARLAEEAENLRDACRYVVPGPDPELLALPVDKKLLNLALGCAGLPAIASITKPGLTAWLVGTDPKTSTQRTLHGLINQLQFASKPKDKAAPAPTQRFINTPQREQLQRLCAQLVSASEDLRVGSELNVDSPAQMVGLFYGAMALPILIRNDNDTTTGAGRLREKNRLPGSPSTGDIAMQTLMAELPEGDWRRRVVELIRDIKAVNTRNKTYYQPYPSWVSPVTGRIHPTVRNCGTDTRRPSSSSPNVLQVSKSKDEGLIRSCFEALDRKNTHAAFGTAEDRLFERQTVAVKSIDLSDQVVVSIDFSQQELRILAGHCRAANMLAAYVGNSGVDIHSMTGAGVFYRRLPSMDDYKAYVAIYKDEHHPAHKQAANARRIAKMINFLLAYGGSAAGLSRKAVLPLALAQHYVQATFDTYPEMREWQEDTIDFARRRGYVETWAGTRRHIGSSILSRDGAVSSHAERQAVNAPIQGGAAEILKEVMKKSIERRLWATTGSTLIAPVYDEFVASVPRAAAVEFISAALDIMEFVPGDLGVPMVGDVSLGPTWGQQIEIGTRPSVEAIEAALARCGRGQLLAA